MKKLWTPEMDIMLCKEYPSRGSIWCGNLLYMKPRQVTKRASVLGLRVTAERSIQRQSENVRCLWDNHPEKMSGVDYRVFIDCKTKEVAYVLGFLWADGYLNRNHPYLIGLEIVRDDWDTISPVFEATGSWCVSRRKRKNRRPQVIAKISNKKIAIFLRECGYGEKNKKSACDILKKIPDHLKHYWWRGFFDGDGCFYFRKYCRIRNGKTSNETICQMSLAGGLEQDWTFARNLMSFLGIRYKIQRNYQKDGRRKGTSSCIRITNKDGIKKFGKYIYKDFDEIGLKRKYDKWKLVCDIENE
jgi:hypothetical protein